MPRRKWKVYQVSAHVVKGCVDVVPVAWSPGLIWASVNRYNSAANSGLGGYEVDRLVGVPHTIRQLLLTLCEQGWLFRYSILKTGSIMAS